MQQAHAYRYMCSTWVLAVAITLGKNQFVPRRRELPQWLLTQLLPGLH